MNKEVSKKMLSLGSKTSPEDEVTTATNKDVGSPLTVIDDFKELIVHC